MCERLIIHVVLKGFFYSLTGNSQDKIQDVKAVTELNLNFFFPFNYSV